MADEVFLPPMPAPDATLDELRTAFRQLLTWAVAREPLSDGGDTQKFVTAQVDGGVTLSDKGHIKAGQSAWAVGTGMFMGYSAGVFRLSLGNTRAGMIWDGTTLTVIGNGVFSGSLAAVTGTFGDVTIVGSLTMSPTGNIKGGQTAYNTGTGFWLGYDSTAYKLSIGSSTQSLTWDGSALAIKGTLTVQSGGTPPAVSGTTMTGAGGVINSGGTFALGNATTNISFNGTTLTLNGAIVTTSNLSLGALSASLSGTFSLTTGSSGAHTIGTITVTPSGGTTPYTYAWTLTDQGNDLNNSDYLYLFGDATSTSVSLRGYLNTASAQNVTALITCTVTDANGRTYPATHVAILTHT